jgi:hypothetical protein
MLTLFMFQLKRELECVRCSMHKNLKGPLKNKERVYVYIFPGVICPNQGLLIDIASKHLESGETVPLRG